MATHGFLRGGDGQDLGKRVHRALNDDLNA